MRRTGKITLGGQELSFAEPTFRDLRTWDEVTEKASRPMAQVYAMVDLVHACLVTPKLTQEEFERALSRDEMQQAFVHVMNLGGSKAGDEGKAQGA